ncbi:ORF4 [White spot syndrome virus]|uniref:ORF4 n=1 Tax=White spot syndrome virus TaxID=342409 RepID=A0A2D3I6U8_9VIRU|nr:ORF4 [White spot syndrome virus]
MEKFSNIILERETCTNYRRNFIRSRPIGLFLVIHFRYNRQKWNVCIDRIGRQICSSLNQNGQHVY